MSATSWSSKENKRSFHALLLGTLLFLQACSDGGGGGGEKQAVISPIQVNLTPGEKVPLSTAGLNPVGLLWESADPAVATVDQQGIVTGVTIGVTSITASSGGISVIATVGVVSPNRGAVKVSLSGTAQYEDKPFDQNGFIASEPLPRLAMRNVVINVIAIDGFIPIASGATAADGTFLFTNLDNSPRRGGLYLQILSKTGPLSYPTQVEVHNNETENSLFGLTSAAIDDTVSQNAVLNPIADAAGIGGAFNMIDIFSKGSELLQQSGGCATPCIPPALIAYWEPQGNTGTFYDNILNTISICGGGRSCGAGDTDEYDDAVIAHEYGHFVLGHFSHDDSPGGAHTLSDNGQDIRLSWSEGWGNFFSSAVRDSPLYVDTDATGFLALNIEDVTSSDLPALPTLAVYVTNEVAVAAVLWDFFDVSTPPAADDDPIALGFAPIWQTVLQITPQSPATFESFWTSFLGSSPSNVDHFQTVLSGRAIELTQDPYETTGETMLVSGGDAQQHTLYLDPASSPAEDEDIIPFQVISGKSYFLETFNLTNGADTLLSVTDAAGLLITGLENDNRNGKTGVGCKTTCPRNDSTTLSSSLSFPWSEASTTLYAHVRRSKVAPPSAALHGAYSIRLLTL